MKRLLFFALSVLVVAVFVWGRFAEAKPERLPAAFPHGVHAEQGLECTACHAGVTTSNTGTDNLLPTWNVCSDCHDAGDVANKGIALGESKEGFEFKPITDYSPVFRHQRHLEKAKLECSVCHTNLDEAVSEDMSNHFPKMSQCMECHTSRTVSTECKTCHLPGEKLMPDNHLVMWDQRHGIASTMSDANCAMCHVSGSDMDCQACHQGDAVLNPHPKNYISRHGQDAHLSDFRCGTCHEQRSFCVDCHAQSNLLPADHYRPGFVTPNGGSHGESAQFDLESCMSCHDTPNAEPTCARCHGN
ncbi:MAG: hypothetical protein H6506_02195 [Calditrichaeota bacterium]|nr:hypothetical protein [Calditrichota bacterium]MCB9367072.1 hypothetical protein [Calditrichota bacterium]MCB9391444.1 hypothetical protein [Calditrichota bacterium]